MKLLYITAEYLPAEIAITMRSKFNVQALISEGFEVEVLTTGKTRSGPFNEDVFGVGSTLAENSSGLLKRFLKEISVGSKLSWFFIKNRSRYEKVIVTSPPFFSMIVLVFSINLMRKKYVIDVRDRYPAVLFSQKIVSKFSFSGITLCFIERFIYRNAQALITVTDALRDEILNETGLCSQVVRNGYDSDTFMGKHRSQKEPRQIRIVQHGLFGRFFDVQTMLKIMRYCEENAQPHVFRFVGFGPALRELSTYRLPNMVVSERKSQIEIASILAESDIGISVLHDSDCMRKAFPVKVFEYIGCELPMLVMPISEAGLEVSREGFGRTFSSRDWLNAAEWLTALINSTDLRDKHAVKIRDKQKDYSRQNQSRRFAKIIRDL